MGGITKRKAADCCYPSNHVITQLAHFSRIPLLSVVSAELNKILSATLSLSQLLFLVLFHGILQARILEWIAFPFSRGSSQPRDRTKVSGIEGRFLTSQPTWKPKNTGVGSLLLLQGIFPTQKSNQGLLHCRWILYLLSYQGSPSCE